MGWPGRVLEGPAVPALHSWTSFRAASYRSMVVGKRVRCDGSLGAGFFPRALTHVSRVFVLVMLVQEAHSRLAPPVCSFQRNPCFSVPLNNGSEVVAAMGQLPLLRGNTGGPKPPLYSNWQ